MVLLPGRVVGVLKVMVSSTLVPNTTGMSVRITGNTNTVVAVVAPVVAAAVKGTGKEAVLATAVNVVEPAGAVAMAMDALMIAAGNIPPLVTPDNAISLVKAVMTPLRPMAIGVVRTWVTAVEDTLSPVVEPFKGMMALGAFLMGVHGRHGTGAPPP